MMREISGFLYLDSEFKEYEKYRSRFLLAEYLDREPRAYETHEHH